MAVNTVMATEKLPKPGGSLIKLFSQGLLFFIQKALGI